jgi:hypothetical protein
MLKSVFKEIWEKEKDALEQNLGRFRGDVEPSQYLIRYWQFASNRFYPIKKTGGVYHHYNKEIIPEVIKNLKEEKIKSLCINDSPFFSEAEFEYAANALQHAFEEKYPIISMFEKN